MAVVQAAPIHPHSRLSAQACFTLVYSGGDPGSMTSSERAACSLGSTVSPMWITISLLSAAAGLAWSVHYREQPAQWGCR